MSLSTIQIALLAESTMNIISVVGIYASPSLLLNQLLPRSTTHTAELKSLIEWTAALTLGVTLPMLVCVSDRPGVASARHMVYFMSGAIEGALAGAALIQYVRGGSGLTDNALLGTTGIFTALTAWRAYFCFVKPSLLEPSAKAKTR